MSDEEPRRDPGEVPVLMYHSISDESTDSFRPFTLSPRVFAEHVAHLVEVGATCLTATELSDLRRTGSPLPHLPVVLTFDDAYRDFCLHALPLLTDAGLRSTLFVPTGFIGGTSRWLVAEGEQRRELLSWKELADLAGSGVECGAHTHSHPQMDLLDRRAAAREIAVSKTLLEDKLQTEVSSFAYPFGYWKPSVRDLVGSLGFTSGFAVADLTSRAADNPLTVPRLTITSDTSADRLAELLTVPRRRKDELRSRARSAASGALRRARIKKRANAPGRAPGPDYVA